MSAITATGLTKRYGAVAAVSELSFDIAQGEIVGFLGPNGAGKTTTLRMLAGLVKPTSGTCQVLGAEVPGTTLRRVGTMIEEPTFYPYLSGRANLRHAALLHGDVPDGRVDEALAFVRMQDAASKKVKAYSQGMRQRLALARALLWRPQVLLLDEPTNGLDPTGIAEFRESLKEVAAEGTTVLVSSHILAEVEKFVDRVLAIDKGVLRFDGRLTDLLARMGEQQVRYTVRAADRAALVAALERLGLGYTPNGSDGADVLVARDRSEGLVSDLVAQGVRVLAASVHGDDLEAAYLKLVNGQGRPA
ncbi:MAG: ATP-binding cassette domain-containing protein [Trueperaceae bacterium]|nr:ATP-binding cassette domain-containing protein [Trueperaceae bacterium]MCC6311909.1 ATP-binding cassette domain-containing protein [Trueperaceae bacterium]MCO5172615.1 ATP-binding cassette domain-containing protein [Trueperaceae bacterium]MCW5819910.1 ATP-binding cassette domain-containing protein [Trueperaceae bacterium]